MGGVTSTIPNVVSIRCTGGLRLDSRRLGALSVVKEHRFDRVRVFLKIFFVLKSLTAQTTPF